MDSLKTPTVYLGIFCTSKSFTVLKHLHLIEMNRTSIDLNIQNSYKNL